MRGTIVLAALVVLTAGGCGLWSSTGVETVTTGDGFVDINGEDSTPRTPVVLLEPETPGPGWHLRTYVSDLGPCVDLEEPGGRREVRCAAGSGLEGPDPVGGAMNGPSYNAELGGHAEVGMVHVGLARPDVLRAAIVVDGEVVLDAPTQPIPGADLRAYLVWSPPGTVRYEFLGMDARPCVLHQQSVRVRADPQVDADYDPTAPGELDAGC